MTVGTENTLRAIDSLQQVVLGGVALYNEGLSFKNLDKLIQLAGQVKGLFDAAENSMPEIKDLDGAEATQVLGAAYGAVKAIYDVLGKKPEQPEQPAPEQPAQ